ncbi:ribosomal protein S18-alanine N-acetyltransferase [Arthrobacter roseus]|uniref:ribosomal protein S18-alanine N-acetyltransferase n=1 Tax=Arthrobacter roseus TaxID=136274 RepID=UPI001964C3D0|nr:ribosomal protein S18-alanine N-acetyltransferase [Arthrobacter roseus]MBM7849267.1 ribosomal-protein-alanine N-acetyltransferase [Arthrobacter roseus]
MTTRIPRLPYRELPPTVTMRAMTTDDVVPVHVLENQLFPTDAWPLDMFYAELKQQQTRHYVVAEEAGAIIGYAGLMCIPPLGDIQTIAVEPGHEGQGIGSVLLRRLIEEAVSRGADSVLLEVRADNPRAQQLYQYFGFEQIDIRRRYYRGGIDAIIMKLDLLEADHD